MAGRDTNVDARLPRLRERLRRFARTRHPLGRWTRTLGLAVVVGLLAGLAALALAVGLRSGAAHLVGRFAAPGGGEILRFRWQILLLPALGGLLSGVFVRVFAGRASGQGTDKVVRAFHYENGALALRGPSVWALASVGVISSGGAAGPEGPTAALGASIGSAIGRLCQLTPRDLRVLLISGCAAGVGAIFGCPLGGALFAASVLYRQPEFEGSALVSAFIASAVGYSTFRAFWGPSTRVVQQADTLAFASAADMPVYVLLGLACGATAILLWFCFDRWERLFARLPIPGWLKPGVGGLVTGAIACLVPQVMDGEYLFVQRIFSGEIFAASAQGDWLRWAGVLALVLVAKCVATGSTIGSGGAGGMLGPSVAIGGVAGAALGALLSAIAPDWMSEPLRRALVPVGMAGVLGAAMRTPIAAIAMVMEMTAGWGLIVPLMVVTMTAYVVGHRFGLVRSQTPTSAESPAHAGDAVVSLLERQRAAEVMDRHWPYRAHPSTPLAAILRTLRPDVRPVVPVLTGERVMGTISMSELRDVLAEADVPSVLIAADLASPSTPLVEPDDSLYEVVTLFQERGAEALPVVESARSRRYLGMVSRAQVHDAVKGALGHMRESLLREHAGLAAIEEQGELVHLLGAMSTPDTGSVDRVPVDPELVGRSLREVDYRRMRGGEVIGIQTRDRRLLCPPDPARPLADGDVLLVLTASPAERGAKD